MAGLSDLFGSMGSLPSAPSYQPGVNAPNNSWLGIPSSGIQQALPIIGGLAGMFPTPSSATGTGTTTSNNNINSVLDTLAQLTGRSNTSGTSGTTSDYGAAGQSLINNILPSLSSLATRSVNLTPYLAQQTGQINRNANLAQQSAANIMAARGLSTSPVSATTAANIDANRIAGITSLQQQMPLLQQQLQSQNLGLAGNILGMLPRTSSTQQSQSGQSSQTQDNTQSGLTGSQGTSSTSEAQSGKQGGGVGGFLGGLGSVLAGLFHI